MMSLKQLRKGWDPLGRDEMRRLQGAQLHAYLRNKVLPNSAFYRDMFQQQGIDANSIRSLDDMSAIPLISKADLMPSAEHPERSREFILIPDKEKLSRRPEVVLGGVLRGRAAMKHRLASEYRPIFLTSTTGRSAEPVPFLYTQHDMDNLASSGRRLVQVLGATTDDRLVNMFPYAPHLAFWQTHYATIASNVFAVSTGGGKVMGTDGNIRIIDKINPNAIIGMPTFIYHLLSQALEGSSKFTNLRTVALGGEKVPMGMRKKLAELVLRLGGQQASVIATYGFTEAKMAFGECPFSPGQEPSGYHLYPDLAIVEVVNSKSGQAVADGEPGEIVFTSLDSRGSVVLRYRTGDFIDGGLTYEPCPYCGRRMPRLLGNISRQSEVRELQLGKLKGTLVDFNELEHVLDDAARVGAWQIEIRKLNDDPLELDELILHVEKKTGVDETSLATELSDTLAARTELRPNEILFHSSADMRKRQGVGEEIKEKRLVDNRPKDGQVAPPRESEQRDGLLRSLFKRRKKAKAT